MEVLSIAVIAIVSVLVVPFFIILCADAKDNDDDEPKLKSLKKKQSSAKPLKDSVKRTSTRSNGSAKRASNGGSKVKEDTVIANGSAVEPGYEEVSAQGTGNTYEEPQAVVTVEAGNRLSNGLTPNDRPASSGSASIVNETSPSSKRSSRASSGHVRNKSQDRALPDIPGTGSARHSGHSANGERSPSTKQRALPDIPAGEDGVYDQLERNLPPHQMKAKSSESTSVKNKPPKMVIQDEDSGSVDMIVPDEVTRSSVFISETEPDALYSSVTGEGEGEGEAPPAEQPAEVKAQLSVKSKVKAPYSKVKKGNKTEGDELLSPDSEQSPPTPPQSEEPIYVDPPPVPVKLYDVDVEVSTEGGAKGAEGGESGAVGGVVLRGGEGGAVAVDENAQDSGSGYYTVTNEGPGPNMVTNPHPELPESYEILTARESIASVRARTQAPPEEEDYYESVEDDKGEFAGGLAPPQDNSRKYDGGAGSTNELYAEIDPDTMARNNQNSNEQTESTHDSYKEELYAEIDTPNSGATAKTSSSPATKRTSGGAAVARNSKGEPIDSAGYAIVKEAASPATVPSTVDDEEDYAECDLIPQSGGASATKPTIVDDSVTGSDSGYATVTFNGTKSKTTNDSQKPPEPPATPHPISPPPVASGGAAANDDRPFQKYTKKKEHLYQEIDEVRMDPNQPDKKKKKDKEKDKK